MKRIINRIVVQYKHIFFIGIALLDTGLTVALLISNPLPIVWIIHIGQLLFTLFVFIASTLSAYRLLEVYVGTMDEGIESNQSTVGLLRRGTNLTEETIGLTHQSIRIALHFMTMAPNITDDELREVAAQFDDEVDRKIIEDGLARRLEQRSKNNEIVQINASDSFVLTEEDANLTHQSTPSGTVEGMDSLTAQQSKVNSDPSVSEIVATANALSAMRKKAGRKPAEINELVYSHIKQGKEFPEAWEVACREFNAKRGRDVEAISYLDLDAREAARSAVLRRKAKENPRN